MTEEVTVHRQQHFRAARGAVVAGKVDVIALHQLYVAAEYGFTFQFGENAFAGLLADVLNRCTNGNKRKVAGLCRGRFALLVGVDDGLGDRVGGSAFAGGSQPQKLILIERNALCRNDLLYHKVALGDGAGLIHNDGLNVIQCFQRSAALEQDTASGACADAGEVGQRYAEHQCARAGDYKEGHRGVDPLVPLAGNKARDNGGQQGNRNNSRGVNAGETGDKAVDLRLAGRCILHAVENALYHALSENVGDTQLDRAVGVDTAGGCLVAGSDTNRNRLTGNSRGIQAAFAFDNLAVQRNAVARAHQNNVALLCVFSRNNLDFAVVLDQIYRLGTQVDRVHDLLARTVNRTVLKVFADTVEQHNADGLVERADRPCTDGCNSHQEVFVKYLTAADVLDSRQQDMAAEQQVSRDEQHQLDSHDRNEQTGNEQRCTDEHFGKRMAAALFLFLLGSDYLDFALDI